MVAPPDLLLGAVHPTVLTSAQAPVLLGRPIGAVALGFGLLAAALGVTVRSRPLMISGPVAMAAGALAVAIPENVIVLVVVLLALLSAIAALAIQAPAWRRSAPPGDPAEIERLRLLHGRTHMSCYAGTGHKSCLRSQGGAVSYEVRWGVAVTAGDPLARGADQAGAARAFLALCAQRRWVPCFFQTDASLRDLYRSLGLSVLKFGEEAVVEISAFQLSSPARADARHDLARARRAGLAPATLRNPTSSDPFWAEAASVSTAWLSGRGGQEMGFSLGRLGEAVDTETWYTVVHDQQGRLDAFCSWLRVGESGIALDLVRRRPDAGAGAVDLCMVAAIDAAREAGLQRVSLGLVAFQDSLGDAPDRGLIRRTRDRLYRRGWRDYSYRGLTHFKAKFATRWESRDIALPRGPSSLLALAALARLHLSEPTAPPPPSPALPLGLVRVQ